MKENTCVCEGGIKSVVVCGEVIEEFCDCEEGEALRLSPECGFDAVDGPSVPFSNPSNVYSVLNWFNA
jgi:hypothetical protein